MDIAKKPPQEVYRCCCEGPLWLVDVRSPAEFRAVRAEGAVNVPLADLKPEELVPPAGYEGPLYLICQSGMRAYKAAQKVADCRPVVLVEGGTSAWVAAGLPVVREASGGFSLDRQVRIVIGTLVVLGVLLSKWWNPDAVYLSAFMGLGLIFAGVTDSCPLAMTLAQMPWNRR